MRTTKIALLVVNILGGIAVLGSYFLGFATHPRSSSALWGNVPPFLLIPYTVSMLAAAAGYLAFTSFLLFGVRQETEADRRRFAYRSLPWIYLAVLAPSAAWMPLTFIMLDHPSLLLWAAIRVVLGIVGLASIALFLWILGTRPKGRRWFRALALAGAVLFILQTAVLDAIVWPAFFPVRF
jgi:hypothetical protein